MEQKKMGNQNDLWLSISNPMWFGSRRRWNEEPSKLLKSALTKKFLRRMECELFSPFRMNHGFWSRFRQPGWHGGESNPYGQQKRKVVPNRKRAAAFCNKRRCIGNLGGDRGGGRELPPRQRYFLNSKILFN